MADKQLTDLGIVIRACGERTFKCCEFLCHDLVNADSVAVIANYKPFHAALEKSYHAAIELGREWTLMIDADLLLLHKGLHQLLSLAQNDSAQTFVYQGFVLDKVFWTKRYAGMHLYKTDLLSPALKHIEEAKKYIRPETFIKKRMEKQGYSRMLCDAVVGLHDFEQSYPDLWCKGFFHGQKHQGRSRSILPFWAEKAEEDIDFLVILFGALRGMKNKDLPGTNRETVLELAQASSILGLLQQKAEIDPQDFAGKIEEIAQEIERDVSQHNDTWKKRFHRTASTVNEVNILTHTRNIKGIDRPSAVKRLIHSVRNMLK